MHDNYHPDPAAKWDLDGIDLHPCHDCGNETTNPGLCDRCVGLTHIAQLRGIADGLRDYGSALLLLALADWLSVEPETLESLGETLGEHVEMMRSGEVAS